MNAASIRLTLVRAAFLVALAFQGAQGSPARTIDRSAVEDAARASDARTSNVAVGPQIQLPLRGPVDPDVYVVGPGDLFGVAVEVPSVDAQQLPVTPEGYLFVPGVGTVEVAGLSLRQAKAEIRDFIHRSFRNVTVDVTLLRLRQVEVHVTGAVAEPGTYVGTAEDVVGALVDRAGGLLPGASSRRIEVSRRSGATRHADLVRYRQSGDRDANPSVLDGDLIHVPFAKTEIQVDGAVELPSRYEWVEGDTIGSLVRMAGGLRRDARADSVEYRRRLTDGTIETRTLPWDEVSSRVLVGDGDQVHFRFDGNFEPLPSVLVEGEVLLPGPYGIREGEDRLMDVIRRAGGFTSAASLDEAALIRGAAEEKKDLEFERLAKTPAQDMTEEEYAYFRAKSRERKGLVVLDFRRLVEGDDAENRLLEDGDRIVVPELRETVTVSGRVLFPGLITYLRGRDARYYIAQAGDFASEADRGGTRVIKGLTGEWVEIGEAGEIVPGDEIWVPERPKRNWWQLAQEAVRFAASIATVYLVIDQATGE